MHAYSKPLGSVTVRSGRISGFTKISMARAVPVLPCCQPRHIGYQTLSLSGIAKSKTLTSLFYSALTILQPCVYTET